MKQLFMIIAIILLSTMSVRAAQEETIKVGEVVVTATRFEDVLTNVPANVTIITKENINNSSGRNVPDVLRNVAGIQVTDTGGNRRNMTVDVRGFGETAPYNTLILVDGRKINQADLNGTDWSLIPLDRIQKIEVIKGGRGAVLYGDNATGGVINIITEEGGKEWEVKAGMELGSYQTMGSTASISGGTEKVTASITGSYTSSDGYRDNSDSDAKDIGLNLRYDASDIISLNLSSGYHNDKTALPGAIKESEFNAGSSRTDTINPDDFIDVKDYYVQGGPEIYFGDDNLFKLDLSYRNRNVLQFATFTGGEFSGETEISTVAVSPRLQLHNYIGKIRNNAIIGFDYNKAMEDLENDSLFFGSRTVATFDLDKKSFGYYVHDEIELTDSLSVSGGFRYDKADFDFAPSTPDSASMDENAYTAGLNYSVKDSYHVYAKYSHSFRYPLLDELFSFFTNTIDTELNPQKSDDYEIGGRYYFHETSYIHVNLFRLDTTDEIYLNLDTFTNENLDGKTRRDGIELSFSHKPIHWLMINGSYVYSDATILSGVFQDKKIPNVPDHKATLGGVVSTGNNINIALNGNYIGRRPFISDFSNAFDEQDSYVVINGKVTYQYKNITAHLNLNNLLNKEYDEYGVLGGFPVEKAFYPSPKFNMLFGVSVEI